MAYYNNYYVPLPRDLLRDYDVDMLPIDRPWRRSAIRFPAERLDQFFGRAGRNFGAFYRAERAKPVKDGFQVSLDVKHFQPNEISVKIENNSVVVNAKHEEKPDDQGFISREFTRRYVLPDGFKAEDVTSTLSSDGVLTIKAPPAIAVASNVHHVQVQLTGPAREDEKKTTWKMDSC